jgi:hypothetical protein
MFESIRFPWSLARQHQGRPRPPGSRRARRGSTRLLLEQLEERSLLSSYSAFSVSDLIADIEAATRAGGTNTIALTAPTSSPYVLTAVGRSSHRNGKGKRSRGAALSGAALMRSCARVLVEEGDLP